MKQHTLVAFGALAMLALSGSTAAQIPDYPSGCARCAVISYLDGPGAAGTDVFAAESFHFSGWGFECESGRPADRIDVFERGADGYFTPVPATITASWLWRPDVQDVYVPFCPSVTIASGFHVYLSAPPSAGVHTYYVNVWRSAAGGSFPHGHDLGALGRLRLRLGR